MRSSKKSQLRLAVLVVVVACAAVPASAAAAGGFLPARTLEETQTPSYPHAADFNPAGSALLAVTIDVPGPGGAVAVDRRAPGGAPERQLLPATGSDAITASTSVAVDLSPNGRGVVAWTELEKIRYSLRTPAGDFAAPVAADLAPGTTAGLSSLSVGIDDAGNVTFAWTTSSGSFPNQTAVMRTAERRASDGAFVASQTIDTPGAGNVATNPQLRVNAAGRAVLGYQISAMGPGAGKYAFRDNAVDVFGPRTIETSLNGGMRIALNEAGDAAVAYQQDNAAKVRLRPAGGALGAAIVIDPQADSSPLVGLDANAAASVVWTDNPDGTRRLDTCRVSATGCAAGTQTTIETNAAPLIPFALAEAPSGAALVTYKRLVGLGTGPIAAAARQAPGPFGSPKTVGPEDSSDAIPGIDDAGDGIVSWRQQDASGRHVRFAGFDPNAPKLTKVAVPKKGPVAKTLHFGASASGVWGGIRFGWRFGDGAKAEGPSAAHAYSKRGKRKVVLTATDAAGNVTTATRTIAVGDLTAPRFTAAPTVSPAKFDLAAGTTFAYALSERARLTVRVARRAADGSLHGVGTFIRRSGAGPRSFEFHGKVGSRTLAAGRYLATFRARDRAGNRSARRRVGFRVIG